MTMKLRYFNNNIFKLFFNGKVSRGKISYFFKKRHTSDARSVENEKASILVGIVKKKRN